MDYKITTDDIIKAGLHLGHRTSKLNPKMADFVVGIKNTVHVIDVDQTKQALEKALDFIGGVAKEKKKILFVCTKPPLKKLVADVAVELGMPYVTERWLGGTFTNFSVIKKRIDYYKTLLEQKANKEFDKYTKKERLKKEKDLQDLSKKFEGVRGLEEAPFCIFVCDIVKDDLPIKEAKMQGIKSIALIDTNANPNLVDYPIPANDDAIAAVKYVLEKVKEVFHKNQ